MLGQPLGSKRPRVWRRRSFGGFVEQVQSQFRPQLSSLDTAFQEVERSGRVVPLLGEPWGIICISFQQACFSTCPCCSPLQPLVMRKECFTIRMNHQLKDNWLVRNNLPSFCRLACLGKEIDKRRPLQTRTSRFAMAIRD